MASLLPCIPGIARTASESGSVRPGDYSIQVKIPGGFEYDEAEIAMATVLKGSGPIAFDHESSHSSLARVAPPGQLGLASKLKTGPDALQATGIARREQRRG